MGSCIGTVRAVAAGARVVPQSGRVRQENTCKQVIPSSGPLALRSGQSPLLEAVTNWVTDHRFK